ncbi:hypothetical protein CKM354_000309900 [Cercospora kikuchii]|uniref:Apple domain-containing protein n=1 Tax=Cercospora kikuchii TaxID=84275 RepID=A0A9P3CE62_9PEZI|nr:uncharacterized protein CKM354_000309900 [Cercospora kikuchii]GIZ39727.1 hypothetical protein CKM354_000309900 [Cercospora kikuchii]
MHSFQHIIASAIIGLAVANPVALNPADSSNLLFTRQAEPSQTISCPSMNGTLVTSSGKSFVVECGMDHAGGDLPNQPTYVNSLAQCISKCAQNPACVDFTLSGAACYMKGSVGPTVFGGVNGARLVTDEGAGEVYLTCGTVV